MAIARDRTYNIEGMVWIDDVVINDYFNVLRRFSKANICFMSTYLCIALERDKNYRLPNDYSQYDTLVIPVNDNRVHWALVVVGLKSNTITYYDSLSWKNRSIVMLLQTFLTNHGFPEAQKWTVNYLDNKTIPTQTNTYDCGIFLLAYASASPSSYR